MRNSELRNGHFLVLKGTSPTALHSHGPFLGMDGSYRPLPQSLALLRLDLEHSPGRMPEPPDPRLVPPVSGERGQQRLPLV